MVQSTQPHSWCDSDLGYDAPMDKHWRVSRFAAWKGATQRSPMERLLNKQSIPDLCAPVKRLELLGSTKNQGPRVTHLAGEPPILGGTGLLALCVERLAVAGMVHLSYNSLWVDLLSTGRAGRIVRPARRYFAGAPLSCRGVFLCLDRASYHNITPCSRCMVVMSREEGSPYAPT
jgi:hypothetical protein